MTRARIPSHGRDPDAVLGDVLDSREGDADFKGGRTWSMVYWAGEAHHDLVEKAHDAYLAHNALNPMAFQGLKQMESEVVQMTAGLLNGPEGTCGTMTSGGTESLLLAVKTWRDKARKKWPWIRRPNIVAPVTIHPAFDKAAHLFGVRLKRVPVDDDGHVDPKRLARTIDRNTILVAVSAPQYVHGIVDPIPQVAALAARRNVPVHVDACFGGFIQPWLERLGVQMPAFDFRVPGVRSISADLHKYGYAAKGASVLLFREMADLRHQFFVTTDWPGGIYASPGIAGTRPGGPIAAAWAALQGMGEDGYLQRAKVAYAASQRMREGIAAIDGLRVMGAPMSTIVTWTSTDPEVDVYAVADLLQERGWSLDRQQFPASVHCTVNANNDPMIEPYLDDLAACVAEVRANPELRKSGDAAVYGLMSRVPLRGMVKEGVLDVMERMNAPDGPDLDLGGDEPDRVQQLGMKAFELVDRVKARVGGAA